MKEIDCPKIFVERLMNSCKTLRSLDSGNFPLSHYSVGEKLTKGVFDVKKNQTQTTETIVDLPIFPEGNVKGLRHGITHAIWADIQQLEKFGFGKEAKDYAKEMKI